MSDEEIAKRMRDALEEVIGPVGVEITDATGFEQQLGMDYLDRYTYEMTLEDAFGIRIDEELAQTFGELKAVVARKLEEAGR